VAVAQIVIDHHLMSVIEQQLRNSSTDISGSPGNKDSQWSSPLSILTFSERAGRANPLISNNSYSMAEAESDNSGKIYAGGGKAYLRIHAWQRMETG
jgi:hypothetical protein